MVRPVESSSAERWLNRILNWMPAPLRSYAASLFAIVIITAADLVLVPRTPGPQRGLTALVINFGGLLILLGSSWLGYGAGILSWTLILFVVPRILGVQQRQITPDTLLRLTLLLLVSVLISALGASFRRRESELVHAAEELERRVDERTRDATRAALETRTAMENLREQAQLLDMAHDGILSMDWDGAIRFWNRGAEGMYGWTREEALGQISHELLKTEFPEPLSAVLEKVASMGHWEGELIHAHKDGSKMRVASRWALRRAEEGESAGILEIVTDITERRRIEEQLRQTQKLESLGVLAGGVAHDFNNLLTGILGNASLAIDNVGPNNPNRPLIEDIMRAADRAADLTRQLLAYAGRGRFVMRTIDLSELVREMASLVQASVPKQAELRMQLTEDLPGIDADPGQLQQIVMNLVINGAEAIGPEGGSVALRTAVQQVDEHSIATMPTPGEPLEPGRYVLLEVSDTGCGMDEATLAKMFDPFFTTKFAGRGLGLSAVLGIVRSHHGALKVYSNPGQGTTVKILLPASERAVFRPVAPVRTDLNGVGAVLVVDDEDVVRATAKHTLERYGYNAIAANDGAAALEAYREAAGRIGMVLLDLTMPVMNGEETLRRLQQINPQVKVLLSSGYNEAEAVQRFAGRGLSGFIQKPYTAVALAEKVKEVMTTNGHA